MPRFTSFPYSLAAFALLAIPAQRFSAEIVDRDGYPLEILAHTSPVSAKIAIDTAIGMLGDRGQAARVTDEKGAIVWVKPRNPSLDAWEANRGS